MSYDFSKISTEDLSTAVKEWDGDYSCYGIACGACPVNCEGNERYQHNLFKQELERREGKDMNKMPELKEGMIVELEEDGWKYLYISDNWLMCLDYDAWHQPEKSLDIKKIYNREGIGTYRDCTNNLELIWSKKSDKDLKIKEIESTIKELQKQVKKLK